MRKIVVLGAFGYEKKQLDGQTIKTQNVYKLLCDKYEGTVKHFDTLLFRRKPWLIFPLFFQLITCKTLLLIPARRNLTYILPVAYFLSKLFRFDIVDICIGGWQVEYFKGIEPDKPHPMQLRYCKKIKAFLPEMETLNKNLREQLGFQNTEVFPNFRIFKQREIAQNPHDELRLVFMARVNRHKGYQTIFQALDRLKEMQVNVSMTFYGQIAEEDKDDFLSLIEQYKEVAVYKGALKPEVIHQTLSVYDVMLLPTQYYTEGFPGSILDAYIAGIPVIVTEWKYSHEFVNDGISGFIVPFQDGLDDMVMRIKQLDEDRVLLLQMKRNALEECKKYSEERAWEILRKYL